MTSDTTSMMKRFLHALVNCGVNPDDSHELKLNKQMITFLPVIIGILAIFWGSIYLFFGHYLSASIPLSYSVISALSLWSFSLSKRMNFLLTSQLILVLLLPFLLMWSLGGFAAGSYVMIWAFYAPLAAMSYSKKHSFLWLSLFVLLTVVSALIDPFLASHMATMPPIAITLFSLLNISAGFGGIFYIMNHYIRERDRIADEQFQNEILLSEAKEAAEMANRAKSTFLANMSHEIRTPLNGIIGFIDILMKKETDTDKATYLKTINDSSHLLLGLINDILDMSKIESNKLQIEKINFASSEITSLYDFFKMSADGKCITLNYHPNQTIPEFLVGDPLRIKQVVSNLLSNAIKFTDQNGQVFFDVDYKDEMLNITVTDNGIGIPQEKLATIFDPFTQADASVSRQYGGSGLGLNICRSLIELMQGSIRIESHEGEGTSLYVSIPASVGHIETPRIEDTNLYRFDLKVLVAEDNEVNQMLITILLENLGIRFTIVNNGKEAIEWVKKEPFDLILMDINMPIMGGMEALHAIRNDPELPEEKRLIPIIALTANALKDDEETYIRDGMNAYIGKPVNPKTLVGVLMQFFSHRSNQQ